MMPEKLNISLLGVAFEITSEQDGLLDYSKYFMSYECGDTLNTAANVNVNIRKGIVDIHSRGNSSRVHFSKHINWDFKAVQLADEPNSFLWPDKGMKISFTENNGRITRVDVITDLGQALVPIIGEAIFHLLRSLAYYLRNPVEGLFMHASAVKNKNNKGVLFTGNSLSGKTTALLSAVFEAKSTPVANDRILITRDSTSVKGYSWPSYASFCEGTLLRYSELTSACYAFEHASNPFRTHAKDQPLKKEFNKTLKRIYPMGWFSEAINQEYAYSVPLQRIIFIEVSPESTFHFERMPAENSTEVYEALLANSFLKEEPSFLAWHGLKKPDDQFDKETLNKWVKSDVEFWKLKTTPEELTKNIEFILN